MKHFFGKTKTSFRLQNFRVAFPIKNRLESSRTIFEIVRVQNSSVESTSSLAPLGASKLDGNKYGLPQYYGLWMWLGLWSPVNCPISNLFIFGQLLPFSNT